MLSQLFFLMLAGCPDPTTAADLGNPGPGGGAPGAPGGPAPDGGAPQGPPPEPGSFDLPDGAGVTIKGTLSYSGDKTGQLRIDILKKEEDAPPQLLHVEKLDAVGTFQLQVPPNTGPVSLVAFIDAEDDGPSVDDPAGLVAIEIGDENLDDVAIALSDDPDLGDLTPGDAPPPGEVPSMNGAAPENPEIPVPDEEEATEAAPENAAAEAKPPTETAASE